MKKTILVAAIFLLAGCIGPGDRMMARISTTATMKNNNICVISPMKPGEEITAMQIYSDAGDKQVEILDNHPVYVPNGECLPLSGHRFLPERNYSVAYDVKSAKQNAYLIISEFSTGLDAGKYALTAPSSACSPTLTLPHFWGREQFSDGNMIKCFN